MRNRRLAGLVLSLVLTLTLGSAARSSGLREIQDSWLLDAGLWSGPGHWRAMDLPRPGFHPARFWLAAGQGRLFSLPELRQTNLAGCYRFQVAWLPLAVEGNWSDLGSEIYREVNFTGACLLGHGPLFGLILDHSRQTIFEAPDLTWNSYGLLLEHHFLLPGYVNIRLRAELPLGPDQPVKYQPFRRRWLKMAVWHQDWGLGIMVDKRPNGSPVPGFEVMWLGLDDLGVSLRIDPAAQTLGPGLVFNWATFQLRTSHLVHPYLGQTHRLGLVLRKHDPLP